jgi:DNA-directed RNA polymerase specialized sigma24 family protein
MDEHSPGQEVNDAMDAELARLPSQYNEVLVLCLLEGLTHEEAAARLSRPLGTVRSQLARGRELLRTRLARRGLAPTVVLLLARPIGGTAFESASRSTIHAAG